MIDGKEMLIAMGFEHEQHTDRYEHEPLKIVTIHILTHPLIPGFFVSGNSWEQVAKRIIPCINILHKYHLTQAKNDKTY